MASAQSTAPQANPPPDLPNLPKTEDGLVNWLRTFSLWCRNGFAAKLDAQSALPAITLQTYDTPGSVPKVYQLRINDSEIVTTTPMALGTGELGTPSPIGGGAVGPPGPPGSPGPPGPPGSIGPQGPPGTSGGGSSGPPVTISVTPPSGAVAGNLWWDRVGGQLYTYYTDVNSSQWVIAVNGLGSAGSQGPTGPQGATGPPGPTAVSTDAGNSARLGADSLIYVPAVGGIGDNRIINGDMRIDQRGSGANGTAVGYGVDRWRFDASLATHGVWGRNVGSLPTAPGFPYYFGFTQNGPYTVLAGDFFLITQIIEADMVSDFQWGSANAQPVTLSFWAYSNLTGTFSGAIRNSPNPRSYPFTYSIAAANTWTKIAVTIPGDTGGTWVLSGNAAAANIVFDLGTGATYRGPANAWAATNYVGVTGAVNIFTGASGYLMLTGVKLEIGNVATPFNRQSLAKSQADCQRYFQKLGGANPVDVIIEGYTPVAASRITQTIGIVAMRTPPTAAIVGSWTAINVSSINAIYCGLSDIAISLNTAGPGLSTWYNTTTSAYITLNAEL